MMAAEPISKATIMMTAIILLKFLSRSEYCLFSQIMSEGSDAS